MVSSSHKTHFMHVWDIKKCDSQVLVSIFCPKTCSVEAIFYRQKFIKGHPNFRPEVAGCGSVTWLADFWNRSKITHHASVFPLSRKQDGECNLFTHPVRGFIQFFFLISRKHWPSSLFFRFPEAIISFSVFFFAEGNPHSFLQSASSLRGCALLFFKVVSNIVRKRSSAIFLGISVDAQ